jgi:hypothetical protein
MLSCLMPGSLIQSSSLATALVIPVNKYLLCCSTHCLTTIVKNLFGLSSDIVFQLSVI